MKKKENELRTLRKMTGTSGCHIEIRYPKGDTVHPELQTLLAGYSELLDQDLSAYHVYGSAMRPMSASWAHIPDAVYMQCDKATTGYHTYVAVPVPLSQEVVKQYELKLVLLGKEGMQ